MSTGRWSVFRLPTAPYAQLHTKRSAVNQVLYHLYQAESCGQLMIAGYQSYEERYRRSCAPCAAGSIRCAR